MKIIHLLQKDILLLNKQLALVILISIFLPILMYENLGAGSELILFLVVIIFSQYTLFNSLSILDNKYEAEKMFLILPYTRKELVISRYALLLVVYLVLSFATFWGSALSPLNYISGNGYLIILLVSSLFFGVLIPAQYLFGYEKTKYFSFVIIFAMPFLSGYINKFFVKFDLINHLNLLKPHIVLVILAGLIVLINSVSIYGSNKVFSRKDL